MCIRPVVLLDVWSCIETEAVKKYEPVTGAVKALLAAKKPIIWAGAGVLFAGATEELRELAERTGIPVFCTMPGKSAINETHPLALGAGSGMTTLAAHRWLNECDVMLCLGSSLTRTPYGQSVRPGTGKVMIQNTDNPDEIMHLK